MGNLHSMVHFLRLGALVFAKGFVGTLPHYAEASVGRTGFEPVTSCLSSMRSKPTELTPHIFQKEDCKGNKEFISFHNYRYSKNVVAKGIGTYLLQP